MVHILASHLRSEFLAVPQLVRFDMAQGARGPEPTLLIKANSLSLKYLLRRKEFRFVVTRVGVRLAYAIEIPDDPERAAMVWSFLSLPAEKQALQTLAKDPRCVVFLFNELAVSVAWTEISLPIAPDLLAAIGDALFWAEQHPDDANIIGPQFDQLRAGATLPNTLVLQLRDLVWKELEAIYITNRMGRSHLSLFQKDEGRQQEEIAVWLTDNLQPSGCAKNPIVHEAIPREFADVLPSYEYGAFLIESKGLSILARDELPDRSMLSKSLVKHVRKAAKQLAGGIRNLKKGLRIADTEGNELVVERDRPAHAIILVPDLSLLQSAAELGPPFIANFMRKTGGFLHVLDPAELLRIVQVAEIVARDSEYLTPMMGFDWYLMERAKLAPTHATPYFGVIFRTADNADGPKLSSVWTDI